MQIEKVTLCRSKKGVPHSLVDYRGLTFSVVYFGKSNLYRIFLYGENNMRLHDVALQEGGRVDLSFLLDGLIDKHNLPAKELE